RALRRKPEPADVDRAPRQYIRAVIRIDLNLERSPHSIGNRYLCDPPSRRFAWNGDTHKRYRYVTWATWILVRPRPDAILDFQPVPLEVEVPQRIGQAAPLHSFEWTRNWRRVSNAIL